MRISITVFAAVITAVVSSVPAAGQAPPSEPVRLETQSAARALDAVPAVFAIARNLEDGEIDLGLESMAEGYSDLADKTAAQEPLIAALGAYGFESYAEWAATIRTIFSGHAFVRSKGPTEPAVDAAMQEVLSDPGTPGSQKEKIRAQMSGLTPDSGGIDAVAPSHDNLAVVIALMPQIETTVQMMQAMQ